MPKTNLMKNLKRVLKASDSAVDSIGQQVTGVSKKKVIQAVKNSLQDDNDDTPKPSAKPKNTSAPQTKKTWRQRRNERKSTK